MTTPTSQPSAENFRFAEYNGELYVASPTEGVRKIEWSEAEHMSEYPKAVKEAPFGASSIQAAIEAGGSALCACGKPANMFPCSVCRKPKCDECKLVKTVHQNIFCQCKLK